MVNGQQLTVNGQQSTVNSFRYLREYQKLTF